MSGRAAANQPDDWDGTIDITWFDPDNRKTEYDIDTAEKLAGVAALAADTTIFPGNPNKVFERITLNLTTDIDLVGHLWTLIPRFGGTFNGNNHTISNMHIEDEDVESGLFGWLFNATLRDIVLKDAEVVVPEKNGNFNQGILAGWAQGSSTLIENCGVLKGSSITSESKNLCS